MKSLLFTALLIIGTIQNSNGQCAIVYSSSDDVLAYAYCGKDDDPITKEECEGKANVECRSRGGSNCKTIYTGDKEGWCGVVIGYNEKFIRFWVAIDGMTGEKSVCESALMNHFRSKGGKEIKTPKVYIWYVKGHY